MQTTKTRNISDMTENMDFVKTVLVAYQNGLTTPQIMAVLESCVSEICTKSVCGYSVNEKTDRMTKMWLGKN